MTTPSLEDGLLLECVVTTTGADGVNIAPMGPIVNSSMTHVLLRPYQTSTTFRNLKAGGAAVLHVTDDVELIARAALDRLVESPRTEPASNGGVILSDACRWYTLAVESLDDSRERSEIRCRVTDSGRQRDFVGFNRAKHAVIEATILATRIDFLPHDEIFAEIERLTPAIDKTGGPAERRAFQLVKEEIASRVARSSEAGHAAHG